MLDISAGNVGKLAGKVGKCREMSGNVGITCGGGPYYVVGLHADFQTSSMCCSISHDYVGWKLELWGKKNDQKDTSKDRIGLYYSVPLLADQNSKYDIPFFNLARIGQYCIILIWISTWVDKKWSNGHMNFFRNWGKHKISPFFTFFTGLVTRKSVVGSRLSQMMGQGITKILQKVLFRSKE